MDVNLVGFEYAIGHIETGSVFERFCHQFLSAVLGYTFNPSGGLKDRGIDGLETLFSGEKYERNVYQISIDRNYDAKIESSLQKLKDNKVKYDQFYYITNQVFRNQDSAVDELYRRFKKPIYIYDLKWFSSRAGSSPQTMSIYKSFLADNYHELASPGRSAFVDDFVNDPRLFVFLRQQWDENASSLGVNEILADTLILFCLEGTDPDKGIFKTPEQIRAEIATHIHFDAKLILGLVDGRFSVLCQKPRRVIYHSKARAYCLPFEMRQKIQERNMQDNALHEQFIQETQLTLSRYLRQNAVATREITSQLVRSTLSRIYYQQGLEFSDFVLKGENREAVEKNLLDIVACVIDDSKIVPANKEKAKMSLMMAIRDIVYNGTECQKEYLRKLSNTYMMLFMLHCDPKLVVFFNSMAAKLTIYVCTSIIIPAMSEIYLDRRSRRHWNLLKGAHEAGARLVVNDSILDELINHFRNIKYRYEAFYKNEEDLFGDSELGILYIEQIMIRAYFYARMKSQVRSFSDFLDNFVNPNLSSAKQDLVPWLKEEFGIEYVDDGSLGVELDKDEVSRLFENLKKHKTHDQKARSDARVILLVYKLRERNNETGATGIFGYSTWWLTKDVSTQKAVKETFKEKYVVSCYMRPDFLHNYIALSPSKAEIDSAFKDLFPSLLGVNISYHLPKEVIDLVHDRMNEHKVKNRARMKAILADLIQKLQTDPNYRVISKLELYLDEKLRDLTSEAGG